MNDNTPGAPAPETPKPSIKEEKRPSFSFFDLNFSDAFTVDGKKFVSYFVDNDHPCYISTLRSDFEDYTREFWAAYDKNSELELCTCDNCLPEHELIDQEEITIVIKKENGEDEVIVEVLPVYAIFYLSQTFSIGIHGSHNLNVVK